MGKINLVGNGCFSTFCTRDYFKHEYVNPFIWALITYPNMASLIKNWDDIQFDDITIRYNKPDNNYTIIIKSHQIEILYLHYRFDPNAKQYIVKGNDGYFCDMEKYLLESWHTHIERMRDLPPVFAIMQTNDINLYSTEQLTALSKMSQKYPVIVNHNRMGNRRAAEILCQELNKFNLIHA